MLPIAEMVRLAGALDDRHRCPEGDAAAQRWACSSAVFLRSSASHVFVASPEDGGQRIVLRLRPADAPDTPDGGEPLRRSSAAAETLHAAGAPVPAVAPSTAGRAVERVGAYWVTALVAAEGDVLDDDDLEPETARAWGRLVAEFHRRAAGAAVTDVPDLVALTSAACADELAELPVALEVFGTLHGDPEPDNVVWGEDGPVLIDLDDVRRGWFAADIAFALRAWGPPGGAPDLAAPVPATFLAGYREVRAVSDEELSWLPALARAAAAETLRELAPLLAATPDPGWPGWAQELDRKVRTRAQEYEAALAQAREAARSTARDRAASSAPDW
jgi:Ser/Thr protein kinase RdoA (MazF antagonist)